MEYSFINDPVLRGKLEKASKSNKSNIVCAKDVKKCKKDNVFVSRDPKNNCKFKECPSTFSTTA